MRMTKLDGRARGLRHRPLGRLRTLLALIETPNIDSISVPILTEYFMVAEKCQFGGIFAAWQLWPDLVVNGGALNYQFAKISRKIAFQAA